ncbi:MAG TPA: hypothetical protein VFX49_00435 [Chloroflexota bacterium]|nr:hypothetical protein [Chloroflexota bacterium]
MSRLAAQLVAAAVSFNLQLKQADHGCTSGTPVIMAVLARTSTTGGLTTR